MIRNAILSLALLTLGACGTQSAQGDLRATLTRASLDQSDTPLLYASVEGLGTQGFLEPSVTRDGVETWASPNASSTLSFRDGVLVSTRGLGNDVMSADASGSVAHLRGQGGDGFYPRFTTTLDGEYQPAFRAFQCRILRRTPETLTIVGRVVATTRIDESCVSPGLEVTNTYWRSGTGVTWRSRQWASDKVGHILTERLR